MNFALLGDDLALLPLVQAILADPAHRLTHAWRAPSLCAALQQNSGHAAVRVVDTWEQFLGDPALDALLVSGADEQVLAAAKQLAATGKPLFVLSCPGQTSTFVYEMSLAQDENKSPLFPLLPARLHPLVQQLKNLLQEGSLGQIHHLQLQRRLLPTGATASPAGSQLMGPASIAEAFLVDADLLRYLSADYNQVTAVRSGDGSGISLETVTLGASGAPQAIWSAQAADVADLRLTIVGQLGTVVLHGEPQRGALTLTAPGQTAAPSSGEDFDPGRALLDHCVACLRGERTVPDWSDQTRAFELLDGVERSIRRRRTIDIYFETPSERSIFKTQMTAAGCSLLVLTLMAVITYLGIAALFDLSDTVKHIARFLMFLPLGVFLALQFLMLLTRPSGREQVSHPESAGQSTAADTAPH